MAIKRGFERAESEFLQKAETNSGFLENSGSCALILLIVNSKCYVANVGDSRAILSRNNGKLLIPITRDHKPCDELERRRIQNGGGSVYKHFS